MSVGDEILTIALGHYSAHAATHFYNVQEASFSFNPNFHTGINHDVLFQEGQRLSKKTYTPRLIIVDSSEALGFLSKDGFYRSETVSNTDDCSNVEIINHQTPWEKNEFINDHITEKEKDGKEQEIFLMKNYYNLDCSVKSWTDYVTTEFNSRTILNLPKNTDFYESYEKFGNYPSGVNLWEKTNLKYDIEENTRFYMEETDCAQGFQVIYDGDNGYSGINSSCLEFLRDEYSKKTILGIPLLSKQFTKDKVETMYRERCEKLYSITSGLSSSSQYCDIVVPMSHLYDPWGKNPTVRSFKNISYNHSLMYHTSAILASALDLITLPTRLSSQSLSLSSISSNLSFNGRNISAAGINLPIPVRKGQNLFTLVNEVSGKVFESLTPLIEIDPEDIDFQILSAKGIEKANVDPKLGSANEFLKTYLCKIFPSVYSSTNSCKSSFRVPTTFPKVFDELFNLSPSNNCYGPLSEFAGLGGLHNCREIGNALTNLHNEVKTVQKKCYRKPGFDQEDSDIDYSELFETLYNVGLNYSSKYYM